eukprot:CAMPEP_0202087136 /NCGR_PEP_ID=MMETSP0964-20121228/35373_1 /ASSEMBLY_ACC=CAM_ASM_000500 /TAXON_ID=4773 /ORGANISM="Schizochytrium aggregatum, Strain ATCC28209" /LENGTH=49 /DNA_ID= /DNA_START= /DNA_END= /DNA_ORIENTATION=
MSWWCTIPLALVWPAQRRRSSASSTESGELAHGVTSAAGSAKRYFSTSF